MAQKVLRHRQTDGLDASELEVFRAQLDRAFTDQGFQPVSRYLDANGNFTAGNGQRLRQFRRSTDDAEQTRAHPSIAQALAPHLPVRSMNINEIRTAQAALRNGTHTLEQLNDLADQAGLERADRYVTENGKTTRLGKTVKRRIGLAHAAESVAKAGSALMTVGSALTCDSPESNRIWNRMSSRRANPDRENDNLKTAMENGDTPAATAN
ncbi:hypothetical protein CY652_15240 [Burkholderia sp. WAC0059]|nr:hypothetical protein CY652_15240 [Burkholderia sp. WAC0059]